MSGLKGRPSGAGGAHSGYRKRASSNSHIGGLGDGPARASHPEVERSVDQKRGTEEPAVRSSARLPTLQAAFMTATRQPRLRYSFVFVPKLWIFLFKYSLP